MTLRRSKGVVAANLLPRPNDPFALERRHFLMSVVALAVAPSISRADLYDDYINSTTKQPFVAFLARAGIPGHAFVGVGVTLEAGLRVYERLFGYYPAVGGTIEQTKLVFGKSTKGTIDYRWRDEHWDVEFRPNVEPKTASAALAIMDRWRRDDPGYNLVAMGGKNCISLAAEIAAAVGLRTPRRSATITPVSYIEKLREMN